MKTQHTPGPWEVKGEVAAAPELLEASKEMCEAMGKGIEQEMKAYDKLKAAIAKATGEKEGIS